MLIIANSTTKEDEKEKKDAPQTKQQVQPNNPSSATSSPSHEFTFTISLQKIQDRTTKPTPSAIDLSPADEIFFHGHLLPLHLLSHLPVSPRSSTNSVDSFTLPIKELLPDKKSPLSDQTRVNDQKPSVLRYRGSPKLNPKLKSKSKSFSIFGYSRWRKGENEQGQKRKLRFDVSRVVKRYMRLVKPFLTFRRGQNRQFQGRPYTLSGNLLVKSKKELKGRKGISAPVSMRNSPTNSGLLVASGSCTPKKSDSTMEELQAAIQSAIAHCKKSIETEERNMFA